MSFRGGIIPFIAFLAACGAPPDAAKVNAGALELAVQQKLEADDLHAAEKKALQARIAELENELNAIRGRSTASRVPTVEPRQAAPASAEVNALDLVEIGAKPIESNNSWTKYSWRAVVRNNLDRTITAKLVVSFQDAENYELDTSDLRLSLNPGEERTFSGTELIDDQVAPRVARVGGRLER